MTSAQSNITHCSLAITKGSVSRRLITIYC